MAHNPTIDKHYARGYQDALIDITRKLAENGEAGVLEWLQNNIAPFGSGGEFDAEMARELLADYQSKG